RLMAKRLKEYNIKSKVLPGGKTRGYTRIDFEDAWRRYLPPISPGSVTSVTDVTGLPDVNVMGPPDVTLVTPFQRKGRPCAQCGHDDGQQHLHGGVLLHDQCAPFWRREHGGAA